jgi:hypothetical protein
VPTPQVGLELFNVPWLTFSAISFSDSGGDFFAEIVLRERGGLPLFDQEVHATCGWIFNVRKAIASRDGGNLVRRDWDVTDGAHGKNCSIAGADLSIRCRL